MLIFQPTFCDLQNIASKTIDILHDSHFLTLKIYEILILNLCQKCRTKYPFIPIVTIHVYYSYYTSLWAPSILIDSSYRS